jgi:CTP synthase
MCPTSDLLNSISAKSAQSELYTPIPPGYKLGQCKYVVVLGTVISGLGKGIFSSSVAKLIQDKGFRVAPIKLEGYLNIDSGTLNPYRHGEVFVLDDGMETDMDLGTYERMLDQNLSRLNFCTSGQIYTSVLDKERRGRYQGRDVQMIPHVTGEVKLRLRELAMASKADVVFVEIGGTVGDLENAIYIEAVRELALEEGPNSTCFVSLTYILEPQALGEQKSKAAQLGLRSLMALGVQPHIVACRGKSPISDTVKQKISVYANVPMERVFSMHDTSSIYFVPRMIRETHIDDEVVKVLNLQDRIDHELVEKTWKHWCEYTDKIQSPKQEVNIAITGKYITVRDSYASILKALEHCGAWFHTKFKLNWIDTTEVTENNVAEKLAGLHGIIVPGGFGARGTEGKIDCIKYARENNLPYLGLCYGFQMAVVEFARNVCGLTDANSTEIDPKCKHPVIDLLPNQRNITKLGGNMRLGGHDVQLLPGTKAAKLYGNQPSTRLRFRHRYEVHPDYIKQLSDKGMVFSGSAPGENIMQILELPGHPFFMGTQSHPEFTSRPLRPDPLYCGFAKAAIDHFQNNP